VDTANAESKSFVIIAPFSPPTCGGAVNIRERKERVITHSGDESAYYVEYLHDTCGM
jgi:hypothetical protein